MNVNKKNRFGGIKRGHACEFTIQLQSLTCLIQQQQQSRKSMLSGLKIANNINQMIEAINDRVLGESDSSAPRTGVLQKKIVISWKRGHKKFVIDNILTIVLLLLVIVACLLCVSIFFLHIHFISLV